MRTQRSALVYVTMTVLATSSCSSSYLSDIPIGSSTDASSTDASSTDASSTDASSTDASSTDASSTDASPNKDVDIDSTEVCTPVTDESALCEANEVSCGTVSVQICGEPRLIDCGTCEQQDHHCNDGKCQPYAFHWKVGDWEDCSVQCGGGTRERKVWCEREDGETVHDLKCSEEKPETTEECNNDPCCWLDSSEWTERYICSGTTNDMSWWHPIHFGSNQGNEADRLACAQECLNRALSASGGPHNESALRGLSHQRCARRLRVLLVREKLLELAHGVLLPLEPSLSHFSVGGDPLTAAAGERHQDPDGDHPEPTKTPLADNEKTVWGQIEALPLAVELVLGGHPIANPFDEEDSDLRRRRVTSWRWEQHPPRLHRFRELEALGILTTVQRKKRSKCQKEEDPTALRPRLRPTVESVGGDLFVICWCFSSLPRGLPRRTSPQGRSTTGSYPDFRR